MPGGRRQAETLPYMKFFPTDWRSDPRLRMCSAAARGLWIEMMCLMHEAEPYGHLLVSGQHPTDVQLAVLAGIPPDQLPDLLGELEAAGVFSRTKQGAIYSRRMTRDEKKRRIARKNGKSGGNPTLGNNKGNTALDNQTATNPDKTQSPESRVQSIDGGGGARARASPVDPMIDQVVEDAQADVKREGWYDFNVAAALKRWRDLGLGDDEIRTVVRTLTEKKRDGPAKGPAYFDEAMARAAGAKQQPGLTPINGGARHDGSRRTASEHRKIRETEADAHFVADLEGWGEGSGGTS